MIAVGPVKNGNPRGSGTLNMCGPEINTSVSLIKQGDTQ